jgi:hypothetical protein
MSDVQVLRELLERCLAEWGPFNLEPKLAYAACKQMGSDVALGDAATLRRACRGSMDAAALLIDKQLRVFQLNTSEDPSGCGADLTWWPHGLGGEAEITAKAAATTTSAASIACLCRALISQHEQESGR